MPPPTIVEEPAVPHPMVSACPTVEIHAVCAIKHVDAIVGVLTGVTVHDVHQHHQTQAMCLINHGLQLIRGTTTTAGLW